VHRLAKEILSLSEGQIVLEDIPLDVIVLCLICFSNIWAKPLKKKKKKKKIVLDIYINRVF